MFFDGVEDEVKISMSIEDAPVDEPVNGGVGKFLHFGDDFFINRVASKFDEEFFVVDLFAGIVDDSVGVDVDIIFFFLFVGLFLFNLLFFDWIHIMCKIIKESRIMIFHTH